jgi:hypothetical protein
MVLVRSVIDQLRSKQVIIPPLSVIERLCAEAITRAERRLYRKLTSDLADFQRTALDNILGTRLNTKQSMLAWLRQAPGAANPRNILEHIKRLKAIRFIALPEELGRNIHQNHLLRLARQGAQTPVNDFRDLTDERRSPQKDFNTPKRLLRSLVRNTFSRILSRKGFFLAIICAWWRIRLSTCTLSM